MPHAWMGGFGTNGWEDSKSMSQLTVNSLSICHTVFSLKELLKPTRPINFQEWTMKCHAILGAKAHMDCEVNWHERICIKVKYLILFLIKTTGIVRKFSPQIGATVLELGVRTRMVEH